MKILIADKSSPVCAATLRRAGHEVDEKGGLPPEDLKKIIGGYEGIIIRSATRLTAELIQAATKLKLIGRAGSGVDNIDLAAANSRDIVVMNTPGGNSNAVAEMALGMMIAVSRQLYPAVNSLKAGRWDKKLFKGTEIQGKTIGLLGYGRVSRLLGQKCRLLGMRVLVFDPKLMKSFTDDQGLEICASVESVYAAADYLSVHLTRREDTSGFVNAAAFAGMKQGVYLINCARGGIVNETALLAALESGRVCAAALDVYEKEPPVELALVNHERVLCTPHIAASSLEAQEKVAAMIAEQFVDFFAGAGICHQVN